MRRVKRDLVGGDFIFFAYWASDLVLLVVLYQLMVIEWQQYEPNDFDSYPRQPRSSSKSKLTYTTSENSSINTVEEFTRKKYTYTPTDQAIITSVLK